MNDQERLANLKKLQWNYHNRIDKPLQVSIHVDALDWLIRQAEQLQVQVQPLVIPKEAISEGDIEKLLAASSSQSKVRAELDRVIAEGKAYVIDGEKYTCIRIDLMQDGDSDSVKVAVFRKVEDND